LRIPWVDLAADQRLGGGIAWSFGEIPVLVLVVVMTLRWFLSDSRDARRFDRNEQRTGGAELSAYNDYLARLAGHAQPPADGAPAEDPVLGEPARPRATGPVAVQPPAGDSRPDG
jgi:putative copper resistance protein D